MSVLPLTSGVVLVVGGSGTLGGIVARQLLAAGVPVRVMSRTPTRVEALRTAGADVVQGDLLGRASLVNACTGVHALVAVAHSILGRGPHASAHVDGAGHRDLIDVAKASGVRHVVYTSVYDHGGANHDWPFLRIKLNVEQHLKASGLDYTIIRPTAFMDFHAHTLIGEPVLTKGRVVLFGRGDRPRNFVAAQDVAQFVTLALRDSALHGQTVDVGGPENLSATDVVRLYENFIGRQAKVTRLPLALARGMSAITRRVHPGLSQVLRAAVLAETTDQIFDARPLVERFPVRLTTLESWIGQRVARQVGGSHVTAH